MSALLLVMRTVGPTGRLNRWRGQILHVCGILAVNIRDRGIDEQEAGYVDHLQGLLKGIFAELGRYCSEVSHVSLPLECPKQRD